MTEVWRSRIESLSQSLDPHLGPVTENYRVVSLLTYYKDLNENPETLRLETFLPLRFVATVFFCHSFDSVSMVTQ